MKKRLISAALALVMLLPLALISCGGEPTAEEGTFTRMTVDVNPSVELMVDDENKVVSVTALNDDGSILIAGEAFIGKTPEEAVELFVSLSASTGYLVGGNTPEGENTVKISVSGDTAYAAALENRVVAAAEEKLGSLEISAAVERVDAMATEALRALAASTSLYTEEELSAMSERDLCAVIAAGRIETALLITEDLREAYYAAKEHKISFAESEATAKVIEAMGGLHMLTHTAYKTALDTYSSAITALDEMRYELLISPESEYQKALASLREAKTELLKKKCYKATLDVNGSEYTLAVEAVAMSEQQYEAALALCEQLGEAANTALTQLISTLRTAEEALRQLEDTLFSADIKAELSAKATEIEANVNLAKDAFFAEFEAAHAADIEAMEADLVARKQALIDSLAAN